MLQLEDLRQDAQVGGILANQAVTVVDIRWYGSQALELTYKDQSGKLGNQLLYRTDEARLEIVSAGRNWNFDADGAKRSASGIKGTSSLSWTVTYIDGAATGAGRGLKPFRRAFARSDVFYSSGVVGFPILADGGYWLSSNQTMVRHGPVYGELLYRPQLLAMATLRL